MALMNGFLSGIVADGKMFLGWVVEKCKIDFVRKGVGRGREIPELSRSGLRRSGRPGKRSKQECHGRARLSVDVRVRKSFPDLPANRVANPWQRFQGKAFGTELLLRGNLTAIRRKCGR